jgi:hypothetical protein
MSAAPTTLRTSCWALARTSGCLMSSVMVHSSAAADVSVPAINMSCNVQITPCLVQLVRFLVVELTHSGSNLRFKICVIFMTNYFFSGRQRPYRQRGDLDDRLRESQNQNQLDLSEVLIEYVCVFIWMSAHTYINICICTVFLKKHDANCKQQALCQPVHQCIAPTKQEHFLFAYSYHDERTRTYNTHR